MIGQRRTSLACLLLSALVAAGTLAPATGAAAEKLFDFGSLNVDLSRVQAKPDGAAPGTQPAPAAKEAPAQQLPSTTTSPAPAVLPGMARRPSARRFGPRRSRSSRWRSSPGKAASRPWSTRSPRTAQSSR